MLIGERRTRHRVFIEVLELPAADHRNIPRSNRSSIRSSGQLVEPAINAPSLKRIGPTWLEAGFRQHLVKPVDPELVIELLRDVGVSR